PGKDTSHLQRGGFFIVVFVIFISFDSSSFSILSSSRLCFECFCQPGSLLTLIHFVDEDDVIQEESF
ncbi:hypothetical protein, partial [Thermoactinomyces sp. CICC 10522]|uniref:hypothetical protein n=1 Tax=Thermoactinomyces sp. CICC 10522 TaxID=2767427 RepID=UPI001E3F71A4